MAKARSLFPLSRGSLFRGGYDPITGFRQEMDRLLEDFGHSLPASFASSKSGFVLPKVDVAETAVGLEVTAELPGFDEKDVSLDIHDGVLTIKAEHKDQREESDEKKHYHLVERSQGTFLRRFVLPFEADADKASAHLEKGLLKVMVPRLAKGEKQPKSISVGAEKPSVAKVEPKSKAEPKAASKAAPAAKKRSKPAASAKKPKNPSKQPGKPS